MQLLRKYQLDIIFLFLAFLIFIWLSFFVLEYFSADPHDYEWFIAGPFIILYILYLGSLRDKIKLSDRRAMTGKSLFYWVVLGILLFASYESPIPATDYWSINLFFIFFTVLLSDSYWDFKTMTWGKLFKK